MTRPTRARPEAAREATAASVRSDASARSDETRDETRDGPTTPGAAASSASSRVPATRRRARRTPATPEATPDAAATDAGAACNDAEPTRPPRTTKASRLLSALQAPGGATTAALIEMTGWQAHTLRAALSGLRRVGHAVARRRDGDVTVYAIEPEPTRDAPEAASTGTGA